MLFDGSASSGGNHDEQNPLPMSCPTEEGPSARRSVDQSFAWWRSRTATPSFQGFTDLGPRQIGILLARTMILASSHGARLSCNASDTEVATSSCGGQTLSPASRSQYVPKPPRCCQPLFRPTCYSHFATTEDIVAIFLEQLTSKCRPTTTAPLMEIATLYV
jgi:hypothetical protein